MKTVGIIGLGNVGITLTKFLLDKNLNADLELIWVCSQHFTNSTLLQNTPIYRSIKEVAKVADVVFLCVKDGNVKANCNEICNAWTNNLAGKYLVHTAGSLGIEVLKECEKYGGIAVAAHPFQTFASQNQACINNIAWGIELSDKAQNDTIATFIRKLNGKPHFLSEEACQQKELYHIVAVAASNYLTAAVKYGATMADKIKIDKTDFLIPIIEETSRNCINALKEKSGKIPLTGPIARKDQATIEQHLAALEQYPLEQQIYKDFAKILTQLVDV